jgi:hypothetical protein
MPKDYQSLIKRSVLYSILMLMLAVFLNPCAAQSGINNNFQLRIAPLNIFDPSSGVVQLGVQQRFSSKVAVSLDYGLRFTKLAFRLSEPKRKEYEYYKGKAEVKYYLKTKPAKSPTTPHTYLSLQAFYFPQKYRRDSSWLISGGEYYKYDYTHINRKDEALSLLIGKEHIKNQVVLDYYVGLGARRIFIDHETTGAVPSNRLLPYEWGMTAIDRHEGTFYKLHLALGFKIGYVFSK